MKWDLRPVPSEAEGNHEIGCHRGHVVVTRATCVSGSSRVPVPETHEAAKEKPRLKRPFLPLLLLSVRIEDICVAKTSQ